MNKKIELTCKYQTPLEQLLWASLIEEFGEKVFMRVPRSLDIESKSSKFIELRDNDSDDRLFISRFVYDLIASRILNTIRDSVLLKG